MSELISGKEALIALANGEDVECKNDVTGMDWCNADGLFVKSFFDQTHMWVFRIKPQPIMIGDMEVPAPFKPKEGERYFYIYPSSDYGYGEATTIRLTKYIQFGAWRTESEIKQVVAALRKLFKPN